MKIYKGAFTLVELIVVITILAILATIGFVGFSGYLAGTRDTNRVAQLKSMSDALELFRTKKSLPIPDDKVDIKSNGSIIAYQGDIGKNVLETIEYTESGLDPKYKEYFSYYLTKNKKSFQLLSFLEEPNKDVMTLNNINKTNATDYSSSYPKTTGKKLGILTDINNSPIQKIDTIKNSLFLDIATTTNEYKAIIKDDDVISGTGSELLILDNLAKSGGKILNSCKSILLDDSDYKNKDGIYIINPSGNNSFSVYCDMTTDGGGWTFFGHVNNSAESAPFFEGLVGKYRSDRIDDGTQYSLGVNDFSHTEMMNTLDNADPIIASGNSKIVFYKYKEGHLGFNKGPFPCQGLSDGFSYKTSIGGKYISGGSSTTCNDSMWFPKTSLNGYYLSLFRYGFKGHYWGSGMGGDNSRSHDGWWYLR